MELNKSLGEALLKAGAPLLKGIVENAIGGIGGKLAGAAIDALAEQLGVPTTPEHIVEAIEKDPQGTTPIVQNIEMQFVATMEIGVNSLTEYRALLVLDAKSEGVLARLWRPLFALVFTVVFGIQVITACWLMWTRQLGTLTQLGDLTSYLIFMNVAGCAVLGIEIWKKTEERKAGV